VQFTKENGIAKESGLQPGDQILSCNGIDFADILFSEAVAVMKSSTVLELTIRPGAGLDLFPSESSGYNSSASSVTGDTGSPCWGEQAKRLSIVREESTNSTDRGNNAFKFRSNQRKDKPLHVEVPKVPASYLKNQSSNSTSSSGSNNNNNCNDACKGNQNTTIIKLSENGPTLINNTMIPSINGYRESNAVNEVETTQQQKIDPSKKIADICFVSRQNETKIVTVEVHQSSQNAINGGVSSVANSNNINSNNNNEVNNNTETESSSNSSCLSSAISDELKRRAEVSSKDYPQQFSQKKYLLF
jgi:hypothetical protein